jgi:hypothetical protein
MFKMTKSFSVNFFLFAKKLRCALEKAIHSEKEAISNRNTISKQALQNKDNFDNIISKYKNQIQNSEVKSTF